MKWVSLCLICIFVLAGCNKSEPTDPFFSTYPKDQWVSKASDLDTREVYRLYKIMMRWPPPWDNRLAESLGPRGRDTILIWVEDLESGNGLDETWKFGPIFDSVYQSTGYSLCHDSALLDRAVRALVRASRFRGDNESARRAILTECRVTMTAVTVTVH
jgi:hypothetical protein